MNLWNNIFWFALGMNDNYTTTGVYAIGQSFWDFSSIRLDIAATIFVGNNKLNVEKTKIIDSQFQNSIVEE